MSSAGYLGPQGSYSYLAAKELCKDFALVPRHSFRALFEALKSDELQAIVVPVENTLNGAVTQNLDLLEEYPQAFAVGCHSIKLDHRLIMLNGATEEDVRDIYSHPQALEQCERYLSKRLPYARLHETASTVDGLKMLKDKSCAGIVGAHVSLDGCYLSEHTVSDEQTNFTTFLKVINGDKANALPQADKLFFTFICPHESGALFSVLAILAECGLNMTKIESRPIKDRLREFRFFIEIQSSYAAAAPALSRIEERAISFKLLGIY